MKFTEAQAKDILKSLEKRKGYIMYDRITGQFKGKWVTNIHVYLENAPLANPWNLPSFSNLEGRGYLIEIEEPLNKTGLMATTKKSSTTKKKAAPKKKPTLKKVCRKVVKTEGVKADGTLKKGYKYLKGGRVVKAKTATATKKTTTRKKTTTKRKAS